MIYTQLELLSIRAPGLRQEDLDKVARVQQAVMRIATLVRELSEAKPEPPLAEEPSAPSPATQDIPAKPEALAASHPSRTPTDP
jgi:hypothetical protein